MGRTTDPPQAMAKVDTVLVVLGNEPLDDSTPTVDMVARVNRAVAFAKQHPSTLLIFTGGPTAGSTTEARMMADLAIAQGVSTESIRLEESAGSTHANARLTAKMVKAVAPCRVLVVSKDDHLEWAMPIFRKLDIFKSAEPLACQVSSADSVAQMEAYLEKRDSARVRARLERLKTGIKGTD